MMDIGQHDKCLFLKMLVAVRAPKVRAFSSSAPCRRVFQVKSGRAEGDRRAWRAAS